MSSNPTLSLSDFSYELPEERIALHPLAERDQSKLLVYKKNKIRHTVFSELASLLPADSVLFFNNTKVIPARLFFQKETGAAIEILLLDPVWPSPLVSLAMSATGKSRWHCVIGNLKRWKEDSKLQIQNAKLQLEATLVDKEKTIIEFQWLPTNLTFSEVIQTIGAIPLPPYIKRKAEAADRERYQTVYSKEDGAVAAPTAGLHFTDRSFASLKEKNIVFDYLTLHVSAGTFMPVKVENALAHTMHAEQLIVTRQNIENLLIDKKIIAVGTTSLRTLESTYWFGAKLDHDPSAEFNITQQIIYDIKPVGKQRALHAILKKMDAEKKDQLLGETSIYILPGYDFKIVDALITNFHQPGSTLMLLVAAFIGADWKPVYDSALKNDYRFLSYGDSSLLFRS